MSQKPKSFPQPPGQTPPPKVFAYAMLPDEEKRGQFVLVEFEVEIPEVLTKKTAMARSQAFAFAGDELDLWLYRRMKGEHPQGPRHMSPTGNAFVKNDPGFHIKDPLIADLEAAAAQEKVWPKAGGAGLDIKDPLIADLEADLAARKARGQ